MESILYKYNNNNKKVLKASFLSIAKALAVEYLVYMRRNPHSSQNRTNSLLSETLKAKFSRQKENKTKKHKKLRRSFFRRVSYMI